MGIRAKPLASGLILDEDNPIDWDHPSNMGLRSEWVAIRGTQFYGGNQFRDLSFTKRVRNNGTMMSALKWSGDAPPGGMGSLYFPGSEESVSLPLASYFPRTAGSLTIRMRFDTNSGIQQLFMWRIDGSNEIGFTEFHGAFGLGFGCSYNAGGTNKNVNVGSLTAGKWYDVSMTWDAGAASKLELYIDGDSVGSATGLGAMSASNPAFYYFGRSNNVGESFVGNMSVAKLSERAHSTAEIQSLSAEHLAGNLNRWNWIGTKTYFGVPAAASAYNPYDLAHSPKHQTIMAM